MNKTYTSIGLVLRRRDWRENDSLFTVYTQRYGKIQAIAISSKKIKSKLAGHMTTPGLVDMMFARSKTIERLAGARLLKAFDLDYDHDYKLIQTVYEILDKSLQMGEPDLQIWALLEKTINWISSAESLPEKKVAVIFFTCHLLQALGYQPELDSCMICREPAKLPQFSVAENGVVCGTCQANKKVKLSPQLFELLNTIYLCQDLQQLCLTKGLLHESFWLFKQWVPYLLERDVKTLKQY